MGDPTPPNETLSTGAIRQQVAGRGRYDLMSVIALEQDAKLYEWGLHHRGERNWEKGIPYSRCIRSIFSHLLQFMLRENDPDHGNCLAAIRFWSAALMHYEEMIRRGGLPESLDDRPRYPRKPEAMEGRPLRIYVSGPISSPDESVFLKNHRRGQMFGKELRTKGHLVFCPHDHVVRSQGQTVLPKNDMRTFSSLIAILSNGGPRLFTLLLRLRGRIGNWIWPGDWG